MRGIKLRSIILCLVAPLVLTACPGSWYRVKPAIRYKAFSAAKQTDIGPINLDTYCFPEDVKAVGDCSPLAISRAASSALYRNRLQNTIMLASDAMCDTFEADVTAVSNNWNLGTGFGASLLSGAGAVVTGVTAKSVLAAGAGVLTGTRSLINDEVYRGKFVQLILATMNNSRKEKAGLIETNWEKGPDKYTLEEALRDALDYHEMCSFQRGITLLNLAVDRRTPCDQLRDKQKVLLADVETYKHMDESSATPGDQENQSSSTAAGTGAGAGGDSGSAGSEETGAQPPATEVTKPAAAGAAVPAPEAPNVTPVAAKAETGKSSKTPKDILNRLYDQLDEIQSELIACNGSGSS